MLEKRAVIAVARGEHVARDGGHGVQRRHGINYHRNISCTFAGHLRKPLRQFVSSTARSHTRMVTLNAYTAPLTNSRSSLPVLLNSEVFYKPQAEYGRNQIRSPAAIFGAR